MQVLPYCGWDGVDKLRTEQVVKDQHMSGRGSGRNGQGSQGQGGVGR